MKTIAIALAVVASLGAPAAVAQTSVDNSRLQQSQDRFNRALSTYRQDQSRFGYNNRNARRMDNSRNRLELALNDYRTELDRYQQTLSASRGGYDNRGLNSNNSDDAYYDPSRDYRDGNYQERVVSTDERVYRGTDGRYYCKRTDGTTGLIVGGLAGGVLGNVIDGGRSRVLGTLLGGVAGALGGRAVERGANDRSGNVTCR